MIGLIQLWIVDCWFLAIGNAMGERWDLTTIRTEWHDSCNDSSYHHRIFAVVRTTNDLGILLDSLADDKAFWELSLSLATCVRFFLRLRPFLGIILLLYWLVLRYVWFVALSCFVVCFGGLSCYCVIPQWNNEGYVLYDTRTVCFSHPSKIK